jgi:hypothetical protein
MILHHIRRGLQRWRRGAASAHPDATRSANDLMFRRVLCVVDFSRASMRSAMFAFGLATAARSTVVLLYVLDAIPGHPFNVERVRRATRRLGNLAGPAVRAQCEVREIVTIGSQVERVIAMANVHQVDLVVMSQPPQVDDREWLLTVDLLLVGLRCPLVLIPRAPVHAVVAPADVA